MHFSVLLTLCYGRWKVSSFTPLLIHTHTHNIDVNHSYIQALHSYYYHSQLSHFIFVVQSFGSLGINNYLVLPLIFHILFTNLCQILQRNQIFSLNVHYYQFHFHLGDLPPGVLHLHGRYALTILYIFFMMVILTLSFTIILRLPFVSALIARFFISFIFLGLLPV